MSKFFDKEVKRLSEINWQNIRDDSKISNLILVKEYLRRAALFIRTCSINARLPYIDAAKSYGKNLEIDLAKTCPQLDNISNTFFKQTCICCLKWAILADEGEPIAIQFHDLYEPLIKLFERGGLFRLHNGEIFVGNSSFGIPIKDYLIQQEPYDISDNALDKVDI